MNKILDHTTIGESNSTTGPSFAVVPKPNVRGLQLCVACGGLNKVTIMNKRPQPLMNELRDGIQGTMVFTMIDL
jgi:hypothetical protein